MLFPATLLLPVMAVLAEVSIGTLPAEKGSCDLLDGVFVSVMRRIFSPGFHKVKYVMVLSQSHFIDISPQELLSEVEVMLTTTLLPDKCTLVMEETLPRGAYIDPDQLRDLRYSRGLRAFVPASIDIEKPEFESESWRVFIFRPLRVQENLRVTSVQLPVHMRYHRPSGQGAASPSGPSRPPPGRPRRTSG